MPRILFLAFVGLCLSGALAAAPVVVLNDPPKGESTVNLRHETPASCAMPSVGDCGSCAVTCRVAEAATCKPGKATSAQAGASCLREPACKCQAAQP
jgi:hypothetical protein